MKPMSRLPITLAHFTKPLALAALSTLLLVGIGCSSPTPGGSGEAPSGGGEAAPPADDYPRPEQAEAPSQPQPGDADYPPPNPYADGAYPEPGDTVAGEGEAVDEGESTMDGGAGDAAEESGGEDAGDDEAEGDEGESSDG